jgi:hypothetical protein
MLLTSCTSCSHVVHSLLAYAYGKSIPCVHVSMCPCVHVFMCSCVHVFMCSCVHVSMCVELYSCIAVSNTSFPILLYCYTVILLYCFYLSILSILLSTGLYYYTEYRYLRCRCLRWEEWGVRREQVRGLLSCSNMHTSCPVFSTYLYYYITILLYRCIRCLRCRCLRCIRCGEGVGEQVRGLVCSNTSCPALFLLFLPVYITILLYYYTTIQVPRVPPPQVGRVGSGRASQRPGLAATAAG